MSTAGSRLRYYVANNLSDVLTHAQVSMEELAHRLGKELWWVKGAIDGSKFLDEQDMGQILIALKIYPNSENLARVFPHTLEDGKESHTQGKGE